MQILMTRLWPVYIKGKKLSVFIVILEFPKTRDDETQECTHYSADLRLLTHWCFF